MSYRLRRSIACAIAGSFTQQDAGEVLMIERRPRPKCTQRKQDFLTNDGHFRQVCEELTPILHQVANKISRPYHIDNGDLVQEALTHIFLNRDKYDENISSIMTWSLTVARRKFLNIAAHGFRDKRCSKDNDKKAINPIDYEEMLFFSEGNHTFTEAVSHNTVEDDIHERQIIEHTRKKLNRFEKSVFDVYVNPPIKLLSLVNKRIKMQQARVKRINSQGKETFKQPFMFHIDNKSLSLYFDVPIHKIVKAKDSIRGALRKASILCGGEWPTSRS